VTVLVPPRRLIYPAQRSGLAAGLWKKCILAVPFWSGVPRDVSGNDVPLNLVGAPPVVATNVGYALDLNGSSQGAWADLPVLNPAFGSDRAAVTVVYRKRSDTTGALALLGSGLFDNDRAFFVRDEAGGETLVAIADAGSLVVVNPRIPSPSLGNWAVSTFTFEHSPGSDTFMRALGYRAGILQPVLSQSQDDPATTSGPFPNLYLNIGAGDKGSAPFLDGQIAAVLVHDRMLSGAEIRLLARDPFVMFRADPARIAAPAGATPAVGGTGAGVLVAPPGAAAAAAALRAAGSAALSGPAARISAGAALPVSAAAALMTPPPALSLGAGVLALAQMNIASPPVTVSGNAAAAVLAGGGVTAPPPGLSAGSVARGPSHAINAIWPGPRRVAGVSAGARRVTGVWRATP